jgi:formate--tetrahydrofolate ligase
MTSAARLQLLQANFAVADAERKLQAAEAAVTITEQMAPTASLTDTTFEQLNRDYALIKENYEALEKGLGNLKKHVENITRQFKLPCVVAVNRFTNDRDMEIEIIQKACAEYGVKALDTTVWAQGGKGAEGLAREVLGLCQKESKINYTYELTDGIEDKINAIVQKIYGGAKAVFSDTAKAAIEKIKSVGKGYENFPVIIAKTQYSLSADPKLTGRPENFDFYIKDIKLRAGAGYIVAVAGDIMLMPGLPKVPASDNMAIESTPENEFEYIISGLY